MGLEDVMNLVLGKLKEAPVALINLGGEALAWFDKVFPPETRPDKIKYCQSALKNAVQVALAWFDEVLPPETRADKIKYCQSALKNSVQVALAWFNEVLLQLTRANWLPIAKPCLAFAIIVAIVALAVWFYRVGRGVGMGKMMKAPGRNARILRSAFVGNPRGYFRDLRGRK